MGRKALGDREEEPREEEVEVEEEEEEREELGKRTPLGKVVCRR